MMPELDGYAVLQAIRADPTTASVPFLCVTARGEHRDVEKAMALGADEYITKPFTADQLLAAVVGIGHPPTPGPQNPADAPNAPQPTRRTGDRRG